MVVPAAGQGRIPHDRERAAERGAAQELRGDQSVDCTRQRRQRRATQWRTRRTSQRQHAAIP